MWIALLQHGGNPEQAARLLSTVWEEEFHETHEWILEQIEDWHIKGCIQIIPEKG
jgi:hypothetical protein